MTVKRITFSIDGDTGNKVWEGYSDSMTGRWNGWLQPYVTLPVLEEMITWYADAIVQQEGEEEAKEFCLHAAQSKRISIPHPVTEENLYLASWGYCFLECETHTEDDDEALREKLGEMWAEWCYQQGLECLSADEFLMYYGEMGRNVLSDEQKQYVRAFITIWDYEYL